MKTINLIIATVIVMLFLSNVNAQSFTYQIDSKESEIMWKGTKVTGEHFGTIGLKSGELRAENGALQGGEFSVDMNSITCLDLTSRSMASKLEGHLKSDDFFNAEKYPYANLKIKSVEAKGNDLYVAKADLTIRGITEPIEFDFESRFNNSKIMAIATINVDRSKHNVKYNSGSFFENLGDNLIDDIFEIKVKLIGSASSLDATESIDKKKE